MPSCPLKRLDLRSCPALTHSAFEPLSPGSPLGLELQEAVQMLRTGGGGEATEASFFGLRCPLGCLERLDLGRCSLFGDPGLLYLNSFGLFNLRRLNLGGTRVTDEGLVALAASLSDSGASLGKITRIDLDSCSAVGDRGCTRLLKALPFLQHLDVSDTQVGNATLVFLSELTTVRERKQQRHHHHHLSPSPLTASPHATRGGIHPLPSAGCGDRIPPFSSLTHLNLSWSKVTNAGLVQSNLAPLTSLAYLNLDSGSLNDLALSSLSCLAGSLTALDCFSLRIHDDPGAACLATLTNLRRLELCGGALGDAGCRHLARLSCLTWLSLAQNPKITDHGLAQLLLPPPPPPTPLEPAITTGLATSPSTLGSLSFSASRTASAEVLAVNAESVQRDAAAVPRHNARFPYFSSCSSSSPFTPFEENCHHANEGEGRGRVGLPFLQELNLGGTSVSLTARDGGVASNRGEGGPRQTAIYLLASLKDLRSLNLVGTQVTEAGVAAMRNLGLGDACLIKITPKALA